MESAFNVRGPSGISASSMEVYSKAKAPVRTVARDNVASLSGTTTINGVSLSVGNRVLLVNQSTASENGVWLVQASSWTRPSDFDNSVDSTAILGASFDVAEGYFAGTTYRLTNSSAPTIDTTALTFAPHGVVLFQRNISLAEVTALTGSNDTISLFTINSGWVANYALGADVSAGSGTAVLTADLGFTPSGYSDFGQTNLKSFPVSPLVGSTTRLTSGTMTVRLDAAAGSLSNADGLGSGIQIAFVLIEE